MDTYQATTARAQAVYCDDGMMCNMCLTLQPDDYPAVPKLKQLNSQHFLWHLLSLQHRHRCSRVIA